MLTDKNTRPTGVPLRLAVIRQLDVVRPAEIEPAFRYRDPELPTEGCVSIVGEVEGRTVRSVAFLPGAAPHGTFPPHLDHARVRDWADLPLALLDS